MKRIPQVRWLAGILVMLIMAPAVIWWWTTPCGTVRPVQHFLPETVKEVERTYTEEECRTKMRSLATEMQIWQGRLEASLASLPAAGRQQQQQQQPISRSRHTWGGVGGLEG